MPNRLVQVLTTTLPIDRARERVRRLIAGGVLGADMRRWGIAGCLGAGVLVVGAGVVASLGSTDGSTPEEPAEVAAWSADDVAAYADVEDGSRADRPGPTTTTPPTTAPPPPTTEPPSAPADTGGDTDAGDAGTSGSDPDLLANPPPPPPSNFDPYAECPHRWQIDADGNRIDTGCASEPGPVVVPPVIIEPQP